MFEALAVVVQHLAPVRDKKRRWVQVENGDEAIRAGAQLATTCRGLRKKARSHIDYVRVHRTLESAARAGNRPGVEEALAEGAHPDGHPMADGSTVFTRAIEHAQATLETIAPVLIEAGADMKARTPAGSPILTALHNKFNYKLLSRDAFHTLATKCLQAGADIDAVDDEGQTLAHSLFTNPGEFDTECVRFLLAHGASFDVADASGETALFCLLQFLEPDLLKDIICSGQADIHCTAPTGNTLLHHIFYVFVDMFCEPITTLMELIDTICAHGLDINAVNDAGQRPLHCIFREYDTEHDSRWEWECDRLKAAVDKAVACGADINAPDTAGRTPLIAMIRPDEYEWSATPMIELPTWMPELVRHLCATGASVNAADREGRTALHEILRRALEKPHAMPRVAEIVEALLACGADPNATAEDGRTPLDMVNGMTLAQAGQDVLYWMHLAAVLQGKTQATVRTAVVSWIT